MSFSDLRANRKAKSYVHSSVNPPGSSALQVSETILAGERNEPSSNQLDSNAGLYENLPSSVEVRHSETSGRGIWARQPIKAGAVIFALQPHVSALSNRNLDQYCSSCFAPTTSTGLRRCPKCRVVWYCDSTCQNRDWSVHKHECVSLQKWFEAASSSDVLPPSDAIRCMGRMLWVKQKKGPNSTWARQIDNMQSHRQSLKPSAFEIHTHLAHSLVQYLGLTSPLELAQFSLSSAADLVDVISRFITNTFTATDPTLTPLGASVSPLVALINHSCDPNVVIVFPRTSVDPHSQEPLMHVVALRDIHPGEEILTSYLDTTLPKELRKKTLEETYNFSCMCRLCASNDDPRTSMHCPKNCGGTCQIPTDEDALVQCSKCKAVVKSIDAVLDAVRIGQEALDKATSLQFSDPIKAKQLTTNLVPILTSAALTPASHPLLALLRLHQSLLVASFPTPLTQEYLDDTIRVATKSVTGLSTILRENHPVGALALAELGKLLSVDEPEPRHNVTLAEAALIYPPSGPARLKLAYDTLVRARNMLLAGFGITNEGGQVGREVRENIVLLEREIDVFKTGVRNVLQDVPKSKLGQAR